MGSLSNFLTQGIERKSNCLGKEHIVFIIPDTASDTYGQSSISIKPMESIPTAEKKILPTVNARNEIQYVLEMWVGKGNLVQGKSRGPARLQCTRRRFNFVSYRHGSDQLWWRIKRW